MMYGFFYMIYTIIGAISPSPPSTNFLITQNNNFLITQDGNNLITE